MKKIYPREDYLQKIRPFYKTDLIKVVTSIRRCGKSCLLLSIMTELREQGIPEKNIIYLNLDKRGYKGIKHPEQLEQAIDGLVKDGDFKYLFIDEVQNVKDFETVVNAYREEGNFSIFITGSNSFLQWGICKNLLSHRPPMTNSALSELSILIVTWNGDELNNVTIVHEEPFTKLIQYLKSHPMVAVVHGKMKMAA